ncbi:MAG: hypothetical protein WBD87_06845 [Candidatus Acidiferrales bacterium]
MVIVPPTAIPAVRDVQLARSTNLSQSNLFLLVQLLFAETVRIVSARIEAVRAHTTAA